MKIAEVSEKYGISADTLRYYERIGLIPASQSKWSWHPGLQRNRFEAG